MKTDLFFSVGLAIFGTVIAYFVCDLLINELFKVENYTVKTIDSSISTDLVDPDPEVYNYKALDPTVEVYVGNCTEQNSYGECVEASSDEIIDIGVDTESTDNTNSNSTDSNSSSNRGNSNTQRNP